MTGYKRQALHRTVAALLLNVIVHAVLLSEALAQDDSNELYPEEDAIEEIVVTGSRIKRRDFTSLSPLTTIDRDTIEFSGQATLEETLNQMPQVIPDFGRVSIPPGDGTSRINLRGMGASRTLVMLNTRRVAPSGVGSAVDVNNLPQVLIERVEIITGGATTVYGSDAVAGVVNFITRDDFTGLNIEGSAYTTSDSDADIYDINLVYGHNLASGRGNFTVYVGAYERKELFMSEREISAVNLENDDSTGTLFEDTSFGTPAGAIFFPPVDFGEGPTDTTFDPDGVPRAFVDPDDRFNFAPFNYLQTPLTRVMGGVMASYELHSGYEIYLETAFSNNEFTHVLAPVPAFDFVQVNIDNPVLTPEARQVFIDNFETTPGMAQFFVGRRLLELGPRTIEYDRDYWRTVVGIRGEFGNGWDIDGWLSYTTSSETEFFINDASASRFVQGLLVDPTSGQCFDPSNGCVPVDIFGEGRMSGEAAQFLRVTNVQNDTERTQTLASVFVTGSPFDTWAGSFDMAFGVEWRSDDASFKADDVLFTGDTLGFAGDAGVSGTENVWEVYAEAIIPLASDVALADYLGLELGARYSEYEHAGGVWTYKLGGDWQPTGSLRFRAMHQRSVRAPNNQELFQENFTETFLFVGAGGFRDPCSASNDPVGTGNAEKCVLQGLPESQLGVFQASPTPVDFIGGGNPNLVPEESETTTVGVVITPAALENWAFSIDYFDLDVTDSIGPIDALSICFDPNNIENLFCENITRDPDPSGAAGNIVEFFEPQSNRGAISTRGIDTAIHYRSDLPDTLSLFAGSASLNFNLIWTHTLEYKWQQTPVSEIADCAGFFGEFCDKGIGDSVGWTIPENRAAANINYGSGPLSLHLTWRWIDGVTNAGKIDAAFFGLPEPALAIEGIGSESYLDLGVGYDITDNFRARFGINNLLDTSAPLMADGGLIGNTDPGLYDVFGRSFYLSFSMSFFQ